MSLPTRPKRSRWRFEASSSGWAPPRRSRGSWSSTSTRAPRLPSGRSSRERRFRSRACATTFAIPSSGACCGAFDTVVPDPPYTRCRRRTCSSPVPQRRCAAQAAASSCRSGRGGQEHRSRFSVRSASWASRSGGSSPTSTTTSAPAPSAGQASSTTRWRRSGADRSSLARTTVRSTPLRCLRSAARRGGAGARSRTSGVVTDWSPRARRGSARPRSAAATAPRRAAARAGASRMVRSREDSQMWRGACDWPCPGAS
jgi:hypothetical protein